MMTRTKGMTMRGTTTRWSMGTTSFRRRSLRKRRCCGKVRTPSALMVIAPFDGKCHQQIVSVLLKRTSCRRRRLLAWQQGGTAARPVPPITRWAAPPEYACIILHGSSGDSAAADCADLQQPAQGLHSFCTRSADAASDLTISSCDFAEAAAGGEAATEEL